MDFHEFIYYNKAIINAGVDSIKEELKHLVKNISTNYGFSGKLNKKNALIFLNDLQIALEQKLKEIVSKHSVYYWLILYRKVDPSLYYWVTDSISTAILTLNTLNLAIHKYGYFNFQDLDEIDKKDYTLGDYSDIKDLFAIFRISYEFYSTTSAFRRVNKGANLIIDSDYSYTTPASSQLEDLMSFYDKRIEKYENIFDIFGAFNITYMDHSELENAIKSENEYPYIFFTSYSLSVNDKKIKTKLSFLSVKRMKETFHFWYKMNVTIKGLSVYEIFAFLCAISLFVLNKYKDGNENRNIFNRMIESSCTIHPIQEFSASLYENFVSILIDTFDIHEYSLKTTFENKIKVVGKLLNIFGSSKDASIVLRNRSPLLTIIDEYIIIDWLRVPYIFRDWADEFGESEKTLVGSISGSLFQEELRRFLINELPHSVKLWPSKSSKLKIDQSQVGEIDIGLIKENVLFFIEAKIKLINSSYIIGSSDKENSLWSNAKKWINQVDECAHKLVKGALTEDHQSIPEYIEYIIPLVCTPIVMFIKKEDSNFFLTDEFPRICTPVELVSFIKDFDLSFVNEDILINIKS